jgi:hypothetical protein
MTEKAGRSSAIGKQASNDTNEYRLAGNATRGDLQRSAAALPLFAKSVAGLG